WMTASKTLRASVNQYECSIATPRSNWPRSLESQDVGNTTLPSFSCSEKPSCGTAMPHRSAKTTAETVRFIGYASTEGWATIASCHTLGRRVSMRPMHFFPYNRCAKDIRDGPATLARLRGHRRRRRFRPGRCPTESQPTGAVASDPRPRGRAGRPALRPYRASRPAHGGGRRPSTASPRLLTDVDSLGERARVLKGG